MVNCTTLVLLPFQLCPRVLWILLGNIPNSHGRELDIPSWSWWEMLCPELFFFSPLSFVGAWTTSLASFDWSTKCHKDQWTWKAFRYSPVMLALAINLGWGFKGDIIVFSWPTEKIGGRKETGCLSHPPLIGKMHPATSLSFLSKSLLPHYISACGCCTCWLSATPH